MNKRIEKKVQKRRGAVDPKPNPELTVSAALGQIETDLGSLAHAILHSGKEVSAEAMNGLLAKVQQGEQTAEAMLDKIPGVGPRLAQMLHGLTQEDKRGSAKPA